MGEIKTAEPLRMGFGGVEHWSFALHHRDLKPSRRGFLLAIRQLAMKATGLTVESATGGSV